MAIKIILLKTEHPGNLGAIARSMMNFGFSELRLVNPLCSPDNLVAQKRALKAGTILDQAKTFKTLEESIADCHTVFGTTGVDRDRNFNFINLGELTETNLNELNTQNIGLLFGPEDHGLSNEDLKVCDQIISIPTSDEFPSINLAHAVTLVLYTFSKFSTETSKNIIEKASKKEIEDLFAHLQEALLSINFLNEQNPDPIMQDIRSLFSKTELTHREVALLRGISRQILNHS